MVAGINHSRPTDPPPLTPLEEQQQYHHVLARHCERHDNLPAAAHHEHQAILCEMMAQSEVARQ